MAQTRRWKDRSALAIYCTTPMPAAELIPLYQQMSELTAPICANKCRNRFTCCDKVHCEAAAKHAKDKYGVELERGDHPSLPFMGQDGCTVAPHLRPRCTMHTCMVAQIGFEPYASEWNEKYLTLRAQIETLEKENASNSSSSI